MNRTQARRPKSPSRIAALGWILTWGLWVPASNANAQDAVAPGTAAPTGTARATQDAPDTSSSKTPAPGTTPPKAPAPQPGAPDTSALNPSAPGAPSPDAMRQGSPAAMPQGQTRESMWPAPTADDWKKPCLVQFQRTWEDAVAVSRETKKMILVCVNMDGEIASEHYAGIRYRQPEIAALYAPYVCVIASVYRHNPRDYDEQGRRILCPRFGSVTCGEHIAIEPGLFDKYFEGKRIAPRHIGIELDDSETYDVYYAWDTATIFHALEDGIANRKITPTVVNRSDMPLVERVTSPDVVDKDAVEKAYVEGDSTKRRALIEAAVAQGARAPVDLLRLAVYDLDPELSALARRALAQATSESSVELIAAAMRSPMPQADRDALLAALVRMGETSPRARNLAVVFQGLAGRAGTMDVSTWNEALQGANAPEVARERYVLENKLEVVARSAEANPDDANARLALAESFLALAADPRTDRKYSKLLFEDAQRSAKAVEARGTKGWRVNSTLAVAAYYLGDAKEGFARAESAMGEMPKDVVDWATSAVLAIFAEGRQKQIVSAVRDRQPWEPKLLTDVHAAYSVLLKHPFGTDAQVLAHYDFLKWLGAAGEAGHVLDDGLARFKDSWMLHDRLRGRILTEQGVAWLEPTYESLLREKDAPPSMSSLAGYASLVAAEYHRRAGAFDLALAAYDRGIAHYERYLAAVPDGKTVADHYVAVALGGRARIAYERHEDERALAEIVASFTRRPDSAASLDGLNISTVDTAKMLRARFQEQKREDLLATLQGALDKLDPVMLQLPAYERPPPGAGAPSRPRRRDGAPPR